MNKILWTLIIVFMIAVIAILVMIMMNSGSISKVEAEKEIDKLVEGQLGKNNITNAIVYVDSKEYGINRVFTAGKINDADIDSSQPFHVASVGKAFTATLIGCLIDDGSISLDDFAADYLDDNMLDKLFVVDGIDYSSKVTIRHLLSHTSGVADYFDDETIGTKSMEDWVLEEKDKVWSPIDLINFTRDYQQTTAIPGETYHYSDTGYILLGLIIEAVTEKSFHEYLHEKIFNPLNMNDSYLMFYSEPANSIRPIADVWFHGVNIKDYNSLSIDWAGGGIVSTSMDLGIFIRALNNYEIISEETLNSLYQFDYKFVNGIHYGNGFMEYHFGEFFPTLKSLPNYTGHMGVLGTQMFYDKNTDTVYISSFGSNDATSSSVQIMIRIISTLERIE